MPKFCHFDRSKPASSTCNLEKPAVLLAEGELASLLTHASPRPALNLEPSAHLSCTHSNAHLSDLQIDDHLIGDLSAKAAAHLAACPLCTHRVAAAAAPLTSFQSLSLSWSERHSATLPVPTLPQHKPLWQRHTTWITACLALTLGSALANIYHHTDTQTAIQIAALQPPPPLPSLLAARQPSSPIQADLQKPDPEQTRIQTASVSPLHPHLRHAPSAAPAPVETASLTLPQNDQQISADNRMLRAISNEFGIPAGIPSTLGLTDVSEPLLPASTLRSLQD